MSEAKDRQRIEEAAEVEYLVRKKLLLDEYEGRVTRYMALVRQNYQPDWPFTSIFDDGGVAWRDAMARVAAERKPARGEFTDAAK